MVGEPMGRSSSSFFGPSARLTGNAWSRPLWARASRFRRFSGRCSPYPATVCPSTHGAASSRPPVGFVHPVQVRMLIQRRQRLGRVPLRHPPEASSSGGPTFNGHGPPERCQRHFHNPTTAFPIPGLPRAGFPGFNRYYAAAKTTSGLCTFARSLGARHLESPAIFATDRPRSVGRG